MAKNRLARESSPYLLQHATNPVDWHPWGPEAFASARRDDKPILLSIGYSACHWCHVMEHESFENAEIAKLMNELFVNVKVDREERPDVDDVYMTAVQLLTGHGGWPMTVFLTPAGEPFYGGTYFPPTDRQGMPGFPRVLAGVAAAYRTNRDQVTTTVARLRDAIEQSSQVAGGDTLPEVALLDRAAEGLLGAVDPVHGGIGRAPKFPNASALALFLRTHDRTGDVRFLEAALHALRSMAAGGIQDHLGGGFHRYSVDERWLVPHFEKMLYDNAQLASVYLDAHRVSKEPGLLEVTEGILGYLEREMLDPDGGFYATQDADSEGVEGKFFVWSAAEVRERLGDEVFGVFARVYDVTTEGNFEGTSILHRALDPESAAKRFSTTVEELEPRLADARRQLFEAREGRIRPARDEKIVAAWNGLAISAFARTAAATGSPRWLAIAENAAAFVVERLWRDGRLAHGTMGRAMPTIPGFLDDYAAVGLAFLDLHEATFDTAHLDVARDLGAATLEHFWDAEQGGFFYTAHDHEKLVARTKPWVDGSVPSGTALATELLLRLHHHTGEATLRTRAEDVLRLACEPLEANPFGHAHLLGVADLAARGAVEVAVLASGGASAAEGLLRPLRSRYLPNLVLHAHDVDAAPAFIPPFAREKTPQDGRATAWVCRGFTCSAPVEDGAGLEHALFGADTAGSSGA